jgi:hypothetical protein
LIRKSFTLQNAKINHFVNASFGFVDKPTLLGYKRIFHSFLAQIYAFFQMNKVYANITNQLHNILKQALE